MKKTTTLELRDNLHLNKSRAECLLLIITALIHSGTACIWKFASCTNALALIASTYRRFQRFFRYVRLNPILLTRFILRILGMHHHKLILIFDRTNFKIGSKHVNLLVLAVVHQKMAVPVAWKTLPPEQKQGNSRVSDRWELLNRLIKAVGQQNILAILGDREFLGKDWIQSLQAANIAYCMRLKENWQCIVQDQATVPLIKLLQSGQDTVHHLGFLSLGTHKPYITAVSAKRLSRHKALMLAHNIDTKNPTDLYRFRWQIEHLFKSMKTSGFNLEDTRLSIPERVDTLVSCITLAFVIAFVEGQIHSKKHPIALKKHGYMLKSYFRNGFDRLRRLLCVSYSKAVKRLKALLHPPESFCLSIPYQINQFFVM